MYGYKPNHTQLLDEHRKYLYEINQTNCSQ